MIDPIEAAGWLKTGQTALDLLKSAWKALPSGATKEEIGEKIKQAGDALARSDAQLAKELKYHLCRCTFPPKIMLWKEQTKTYDCPNEACGRKIKIEAPKRTVRNPNWLNSDRF